jgi:hypothetical protein
MSGVPAGLDEVAADAGEENELVHKSGKKAGAEREGPAPIVMDYLTMKIA